MGIANVLTARKRSSKQHEAFREGMLSDLTSEDREREFGKGCVVVVETPVVVE